MHRLFCISVSLLVCFGATAQIAEESLSRLDTMLVRYVSAIEHEDVSVKCSEVNFLVESSEDSVLRDRVAQRLFCHYRDSRLMGDEEVAVRLFNDWFATGKAHFTSAQELSDAVMFVEFNKSTLLGQQAPQLELQGIDGEAVTLPETGVRNILFFYDTDCSKCRMETIMLRNYLEEMDSPLCMHAVYVGDDRDSWEEYAGREFGIRSDKVTVVHSWDPGAESGLLYMYGITMTPKMYLVDSEGRIEGRRLDTESLRQLIEVGKIREELKSRAAVGSMIENIRVPGIKLTAHTETSGKWNLRSFKCVVFYTSGCSFCEEAVSVARAAAAGGDKVLLVNLDEIILSDKKLASKLFDVFDMTHLPLVLHLSAGRIVSKNQ